MLMIVICIENSAIPKVVSLKMSNADKYLSEDELVRLLASIEDLEDKSLVLFGLETGLRRSEVVSILTSNIDFTRQLAQVYDEKKDHWRDVVFPRYIGSHLRMYLNIRTRKSARLFPFSSRTANRKLRKWCERAEVRLNASGRSMVTFHWLRHTFIRRSKMVGRDIKLVQQNTGDTVETILRYYRELSVEDRLTEIESKPILPSEAINHGSEGTESIR